MTPSYPSHDVLHRRIGTLLDTIIEAWGRHTPLDEELDWQQFHQDLAALLAAVHDHGREHLRHLLEIAPRDPGGPPWVAARARAGSLRLAAARMRRRGLPASSSSNQNRLGMG